MGESTKTIRVSEDLHALITAHNRDDETISETLERLIDGPSLRELAGILSDEEADTFRAAIEDRHRDHDAAIERMLDRME